MTNHTETIRKIHQVDSTDATLTVVQVDDNYVFTYWASAAADDTLVCPDGSIIDVIAHCESGRWPTGDLLVDRVIAWFLEDGNL